MTRPMLRNSDEWREWVLHEEPAPPELPEYSEYRALDVDERQTVDELRREHNAKPVLVRTPAMEETFKAIRQLLTINENSPPGARRGLVIDGDPTVGKTTTLTTFGKTHERRLRRRFPERFEQPGRVYNPVVYFTVPNGATPKSLASGLSEYLNIPGGGPSSV